MPGANQISRRSSPSTLRRTHCLLETCASTGCRLDIRFVSEGLFNVARPCPFRNQHARGVVRRRDLNGSSRRAVKKGSTEGFFSSNLTRAGIAVPPAGKRSYTAALFATHLLESGYDIRTVRKLLGPSDVEWGELSPWASSLEIEKRLGRQLNAPGVPFTLVALDNMDVLLGTASVKLFELPEHRDRMHWLGEVCVKTGLRGQGVGTALIRACIAESRRHRLPTLYLGFRDEEGCTPLHAAIESSKDNKYELLQLLLSADAPVNLKGINDWTPAHMAAARDDVKALRLVQFGADLAIRTEIDEYVTPLEEAQNLGKSNAAAYLETVV